MLAKRSLPPLQDAHGRGGWAGRGRGWGRATLHEQSPCRRHPAWTSGGCCVGSLRPLTASYGHQGRNKGSVHPHVPTCGARTGRPCSPQHNPSSSTGVSLRGWSMNHQGCSAHLSNDLGTQRTGKQVQASAGFLHARGWSSPLPPSPAPTGPLASLAPYLLQHLHVVG